jgi:hypothetical protein
VELERFIISRDGDYELDENSLASIFSRDYDEIPQTDILYTNILEEEDIYIPTSIFSNNISCFQAIVKYLKDYKKLKFSEIAFLTNRDQRSIWNTYNQAKKAYINVEESRILLPLSTIKNRKISVLGSVVKYLKARNISTKDIAFILGRHYQTIFTAYRRVKLANE